MNKKIILSILLIFISGCGNGISNKDINTLIEEKRKNSYSMAEEIKTLTEYESYIYNSFDEKDPFEKFVDEKIVKKRKDSVIPNFDREKEYLEKFELSELKLTGIMKSSNNVYMAVFYDGFKNHILKTGNHLGKNYGKISKIMKNKVIIDEIYKEDGINLWIKKESIIELNSYNP